MAYLDEIKKKHSPVWKGGALVERQTMFRLASLIASQEKLSKELTNDYLLTIGGESGFNQWCQNEDTKDYGIAQFSLRYYCKEYQMTPQECLENPEKQLRIMARNFKSGRQSNWVAYAGRKQHAKQLIELSVPDDLETKRAEALKNAQSIIDTVVESNLATTTKVSMLTSIWQLLVKTLQDWYNGK